ncbi:MAG TPA: hypothetical protein VKT32_11405, partial [Chthonomonadaceae bacterium]|nr:hypothetical protein [Chthonomonadaceae bacterium]
MMQTDTLDAAAQVALSMLRDHPVLSRYGANLSVLVAASYATGFEADSSESDACFFAAPAIWEELAVELERGGFATGGSPYDVRKDGWTMHCFALPLSRYIDALERDEDAAVYRLCHGRTVHDGNGQWRAVQESHSVPAEGFAASRVARYRALMSEWILRWEAQISTDRPLQHAFSATSMVHAALPLCCWLDGHAPCGPGALMEQAARCSEGCEIVPAAHTLLRALGRFLSGDHCEPPALSALVGAGRALAGACERAIARSAFDGPGSGS